MNAIKMRVQKSSRPLVILLATVVAIITSIVVANATQTITTPNAASISYSLAAGADSAATTLATNKSVLVMGCCTGPATDAGVGQVSLLATGNASVGLQWGGLESTPNINFTQGSDAIAKGLHIVFIDYAHKVDIRVASFAAILIHNADTVTHAGNVTIIW